MAREIEDAAAAGAVDELREGVREAAGADVMDGEDRIRGAEREAAVDDLLGAPLDLRVAALHRIEVELDGVGAAASELAAPPPMPIRMPGPPSCTSSVPGPNSIFLVCVEAIEPRPPAIMIGL